MIVVILQPSYLPWLGYFEQMQKADVFVYYDDVQFEKGSWRNRNRIRTPEGCQWLTVPVLTKGKGFQSIHDITVNPAVAWQRKHIGSIRQHYSKAPFFDHYAEALFRIIDQPWRDLVDLDITLSECLKDQLCITTRTVRSSELGVPGRSTRRLVDIIKTLGGNVFYEGRSGQNYIDVKAFEQAGIELVYQDYEHPEYNQIYDGFVPYMSVIDLLFNHGPDSLNILLNRDDRLGVEKN
jgi:hypothetical protein